MSEQHKCNHLIIWITMLLCFVMLAWFGRKERERGDDLQHRVFMLEQRIK